MDGDCEDTQTCHVSNCYESAPCDQVVCPTGNTCFEGACFPTVTGINSGQHLDISIYPNPSDGMLYIDGINDLAVLSIVARDVLGRILINERLVPKNGKTRIDLTSISKGKLVLLTIASRNQSFTEIIQIR